MKNTARPESPYCWMAALWTALGAYTDFYRVLGASRQASRIELEDAYQRQLESLAKSRWKSWAHARRHRVQAAFDTLINQQARRAYDEQLEQLGGHYPQPPV